MYITYKRTTLSLNFYYGNLHNITQTSLNKPFPSSGETLSFMWTPIEVYHLSELNSGKWFLEIWKAKPFLVNIFQIEKRV